MRRIYRTEPIESPVFLTGRVSNLVTWSGGKDSSALLIWALQHLPPEKTVFIFCNTGFEADETYAFLDSVNKRLLGGKLITLQSSKYEDLLDLAAKKQRFPSPKARFCTLELKTIPTIEYILKQKGNIAVYQGIRAGESIARALMKQQDDFFYQHLIYKRSQHMLVNGQRKQLTKPPFYKEVISWLTNNSCTVHRPLFYWKKDDVLALCRKHDVLNELYDVGFDRVGCFPCIMTKKAEIDTLSNYAPERIDIIDKAEQEIGSTFFPYSKVPDSQCKEPRIKDVVRWASSKTRSQEQHNPSCMGHYAQCE